MKNVPKNSQNLSPEQIKEYQQKSVELASLVASTMSVKNIRKILPYATVLDKQILRLLKRGYQKQGDKTIEELTAILSEEKNTPSKKTDKKFDVDDLDQYDYQAGDVFQKTLERIRELFAIPEVRERYFLEYKKRQPGFVMLAEGEEGNNKIEKIDKYIDRAKEKKWKLMAKKYFKGSSISDPEKERINQNILDLEQKILDAKSDKDKLLSQRSTATTHRLSELKKMKQANGYIMTKSREEIFEEAIEKFFMGQHILLKGDTGSGKTALAEEIIKKLEELTGEQITQIKADHLTTERKDQELIKKIEKEVMVLSGNPQTGTGDIIGKQSLEGGISTKFQYGKLLKAFFEGRVLLLDEIDSIPGDILMRVKHLFELKTGRLYAPQENGNDRRELLQTKVIATANIKSERYEEKEKIPVPIQDLFGGSGIEVGYLDKNEIYDFILAELMNNGGCINGIGQQELGDKERGILPKLIICIKEIESLFSGSGSGIKIGNEEGVFLENAMFTMRRLVPIFSQYPGGDIFSWIKTNIIDFIASANSSTDRCILLKVFSKQGFISQEDISGYKHRGQTRNLSQVINLSEKELKDNIIGENDKKDFSKSEIQFIDPYQLANLDPFKIRNFDQRISKSPEELIKSKLQEINQSLIARADDKYENLITILEQITDKEEIDQDDSIACFDEIYDNLQDKDLFKKFEQLGGGWKLEAEKKRIYDFKDPSSKKLFVGESPLSASKSSEIVGDIESQLIKYQLTTHNERVNLYKTTGEMVEEDSGDKIQTHLTDEEKRAIPMLKESDITDIQNHERTYNGEKYHILTYKKQGEQYTAIQVPQQIKTMKYKDTHLGSQLTRFKDKDRYPAFLTDDKLDSPLDKEWLIQKSSPAYNADGTPHVDINLYNDGDSKGDILREVAKTGGKMMTITDNIIMTELIKQTLGEAYVSKDFCGQNFDPTSTDPNQQKLQNQLKEIEDMFLVQYEVNQKDSKGYLNRDYGIYRQQKDEVKDGENVPHYRGYLRGDFDSDFSALGGVASVDLFWDLGISDSINGFRPCG